MNRFLSVCFAMIASCLPALAQTGTPIKQSGNVTPAHVGAWTTNGILQDGGTAAVPYLTSIGTVGQGQTICAWTALSTAPGSQKLCFGVFDNSAATITLQNFGIDTPQALNFVINGVTYPFPFTVGGIVGPATSVIGHAAIWNNTTGSLLADSGTTLRQKLSTTQFFYVNGNSGGTATCGEHGTSAPLTCAAGNDSNNCLTPATACLTSQHVMGLIFGNYDSGGQTIVVNGAHCSSASCGTNLAFSCAQGPVFGNSTIFFVGDFDNPTAVEMFAPNGGVGIVVNDQCTVSIDSIAIADQGSAVAAISVPKFGQIDVRSTTITGTWNTGAAIFSVSHESALINMLGVGSGGITNTIASTSTGQIFNASSAGMIDFAGQTVAIPSAVTVGGGQFFAVNTGGTIVGISGSTFTGSGVAGTTGNRCFSIDAYWGSVDPNMVFPGNANCTQERTFNSANITGPSTGGGTMTLQGGSDTLVARATTDTLTNKTIDGGSNTLTNVGNTSLSHSATTVDGQTCTLGSSCQTAISAQSDYAATTWTPAITTTSTVGTPAYSIQVGSYEKIGRQVTVRFDITLSGWTGSPTGNVEISGLPVAAANVANDYGTCIISNYAVTGLASSNLGITGLISPNTSVIILYQNGGTGSTQITAAQMGTTLTVVGFCNYHT